MWPLIEAIQTWYIQSGLGNARITVPALETTILFAVMTLCLLFRFCRIGLLVSYLFVFRWGWAFRHTLFPDDPAGHLVFSVIYIIFGLLVFVFTTAGMLVNMLHRKKIE